MPQNVETEMLLITSDDYWGHAGDFDPAVNFYPYTFIITQSQYASMDDSDKGRFFPCALFYYAGETDNHGFQPRRIGCRVEDDDTVSMGRVMGINRQGDQEVRTYRLGTEQGYAIPGYASMSMLKGEGDSYEAIESAAEAGSLPVGGFDISGLIYNQEAVVDTINTVAGIETDDSAAENFSAEEATPFEYDGAEPEAYVARPEATPVGYDVDDNSAAVEDYFASEGYNFNHTVGDFAQDSAAGSGYGVPEYYGTNSMSPMAFEAEVMYGTDGSVVGQAIGNWDSTPFGYQAEGDEGPEVMWEQDEFVSVRDGSARDAIADEYMDMGEDYDDAEDYARRAAKKMSAEGLGDYTGPLTNGFGENSASVSDYGVPVWYGSAEEAYNGMGENSASISGQGVPQWYGSAEELGVGVGMPAVDDGFYPNSYGEDSSTFGQGVPQWYGSAESTTALTNMTDDELVSQFRTHQQWLMNNGFTSFHQIVPGDEEINEEALSHLENMAQIATALGYRGRQSPEYLDMSETLMSFYLPSQTQKNAEQGYNDKMDESLGMRHRGSHSQSMKDRRDEASAMDKGHSTMGRKYDDVMTMDAEPVVKVQKSETKMAMAIGAAVLGALTAYTLSRKVQGSDEPEEPEEPEE
ncbi:MAG: hypothetical protein GY751_20380 [Bacteroidetes bacterium]|nr:hypothetical protein [Bacteroidota bacterium]